MTKFAKCYAKNFFVSENLLFLQKQTCTIGEIAT